MTMMRLLALESALQDVGWFLLEPRKDRFTAYRSSIEWCLAYRNTPHRVDITIFLTNGFNGVTDDLADIFNLSIEQTGETFFFEKINSPEWRRLTKDIQRALSRIASGLARKK